MKSSKYALASGEIWTVLTLGAPRAISSKGAEARFRTKGMILLALLAIDTDQVHERDALADALWPDVEQADRRHSLSVELYTIRNKIGHDAIDDFGGRTILRANPDHLTSDIRRFEELVRKINLARDDAFRIRKIKEFAQLYAGEGKPSSFFANHLFDAFRIPDRSWQLLAQFAGELLKAEEYTEALKLADLSLQREPSHRENPAAYLHRVAAMAEVEGSESAKSEVMRLIGSRKLPPDFLAALKELPLDGMARGQHPPRGKNNTLLLEGPKHAAPNWDTEDTQFFGRETDIKGIIRCMVGDLSSPRTRPFAKRLLVLTGIAGSGKTRLAKRVMDEIAKNMREGNGPGPLTLEFVSLDGVTEEGDFFRSIAKKLFGHGFDDSNPKGILHSKLEVAPTLIVLDSMECFLARQARGGEAVEEILACFSNLAFLVTSWTALGLHEAQRWHISSLSMPPSGTVLEDRSGFAGPLLFVDQARLCNPFFVLDSKNGTDVVEICSELDAIPLALRMVAALADAQEPARILSEVREHPWDVVQYHHDTLPERHRSLRSAFTAMLDLLPSTLRSFFCRLSVFHGGWEPEAAARVCDEPLAIGLLLELRNWSLVEIATGSGDRRLVLHNMVCRFAGDLLVSQEREYTRARHASYYLDWIDRSAGTGYYRSFDWITAVGRDIGNIRAALSFYLDTGGDQAAVSGLQLTERMCYYWLDRAETGEARKWLGAFIHRMTSANGKSNALLRASALRWSGNFAWRDGDNIVAKGLLGAAEEALSLCEPGKERDAIEAGVLNSFGVACMNLAEFSQAEAALVRSEQLYAALGDEPAAAQARSNLANAYEKQERFGESLELHAKVRDTRERLARDSRLNPNGPWSCIRWDNFLAQSIGNIGNVYLSMKLPDKAMILYQEQADLLSKPGGNPHGAATALHNCGCAAYVARKFDLANQSFENALERRRKLNERGEIASTLAMLGKVALKHGDLKKAFDCLQEGTDRANEQRNEETYVTLGGLAGSLAANLKLWRHVVRAYDAAEALRKQLGLRKIASGDEPEVAAELKACQEELGESGYDQAKREAAVLPIDVLLQEMIVAAGLALLA